MCEREIWDWCDACREETLHLVSGSGKKRSCMGGCDRHRPLTNYLIRTESQSLALQVEDTGIQIFKDGELIFDSEEMAPREDPDARDMDLIEKM